MGKKMIKKGLAVAVILLFIGVAFASSINADSTIEKEINENIIGLFSGISNRNCKIRGEVTYAEYLSLPYILLGLYAFGFKPSLFFDFPIKFGGLISFGISPDVGGEKPSVGWLWTDGRDGIQEFNGKFLGGISEFFVSGGIATDSYWIGVKGFRGTMVTDSTTGITSIDGRAIEVKIYKY
jgi:hypothetical protein